MSFFIADVLKTLLAAVLCVPALLLPGATLAAALDAPGFRRARTRLDRMALALLCAFAGLPILLDLAGRLGPRAMPALALLLALPGGFVLARRPQDRVSASATLWTGGALAAFAALAIGLLVDWPLPGGGLARSLLMDDHVKHATATWAIAQAGTPPYNPTFFEAGTGAVYYYFFYTLTAVVQLMGDGLFEGRHAAFAVTIWTAPALFALARTTYAEARFDAAIGVNGGRASEGWLLVLLLATGLDLVGVVVIGVLSGGGNWLLDFEQWNTQVSAWLTSVLWVPHHVAALVAAMIGFMTLARDTEDTPPRSRSTRHIALAGLAFASLAGLSIYVAFGAAVTGALWLATLLWRRRLGAAAQLVTAGVLAAGLALPWILTILRGRVMGPDAAPIAFGVRRFVILDVLFEPGGLGQTIANLLALPLSYGLEFGVFLIGSVAFWRIAGRRGLASELGLVLMLGTVTSFLVGSFLRSTILFNDLGWRVMLFAQLAALVWTLAAVRAGLLARPLRAPRRPVAALFLACLAIGFAGEIYGAVQIRRNPQQSAAEAEFLPRERAAWEALERSLPAGTVVQENPDRLRNRAYAYGLYGHFPTAVSDTYNGLLFGGAQSRVAARIATLAPVFADPGLGYAEAMARARAEGVQVVMVTPSDAVFGAASAWTREATPLVANGGAAAFAVPAQAEARR